MAHKRDEGYYRVAASWFMAMDDGKKSNSYWARVFNVDWQTIANWRATEGKVDRYRVSPALLARAEELLKSGKNYRTVAREVGGVSDTTLRNRFPGYANNYFKSKAKPETTDEKALRFLEDGASYLEVGKTVGLSADEVKRRFPGYSWTNRQSAKFNSDLKRIQRGMPENIFKIMYPDRVKPS